MHNKCVLNVILQEESVCSFLWCNIIHPVSFINNHHHFTCIYVAVGHHYPFSWLLTSLPHFWTPWSVPCALHVFTFCHKSLFIWLPYQQSLPVWLPHKNTWATGAHLLPSQWLHIIAHVAICAVILFSWLFVFVLFFLSRDSFEKPSFLWAITYCMSWPCALKHTCTLCFVCRTFPAKKFSQMGVTVVFILHEPSCV